MPASRKAKDDLKAKRLQDETPRKDDVFAEGYKWAEFESHQVSNRDQIKVDFTKPDQLWHYLGKTSTEARAQYTEDPAQQRHNPKGNFLDTISKPPRPAALSRLSYHHQSYIAKAMAYSYNLAANHVAANRGIANMAGNRVAFEKPYVYKPKQPVHAKLAAYTGQQLLPSNPLATAANSSRTCPSHNHQTLTPSKQLAMHGQPSFRHVNHNFHHVQPHPSISQRPHQPLVTVSSQQGRPPWQVYSSVYQKYPFFQVNHNR